MTLAPQSASWRTQVGPERTRVRSSTVNRARALDARGNGIFPEASKADMGGRNFADPGAVVYRPASGSFRRRRSAMMVLCNMDLAIFPALSGDDHERRGPERQ